MKFPAVNAEVGLHVFLINASFAGAAGRGKRAAMFSPSFQSRAAASSLCMSSSSVEHYRPGGIYLRLPRISFLLRGSSLSCLGGALAENRNSYYGVQRSDP